MKKQNTIVLSAILTLCATFACSKAKAPDVLDQRDEPTSVGRTTQCTSPNADGVRCDVKTCKADAASDCKQFEDGCVKSNHTYSGDKDSGTCTRGPLIGASNRRGRILNASQEAPYSPPEGVESRSV